MNTRIQTMLRQMALIALICLIAVSPASSAGKKFDGRWTMSVTIPVSSGDSTKRTLILNMDASPRVNSLHGRVTITDEQNRTFGGVWRQTNKKVSITFEMPCEEGVECATVVMIGKMKSSNTKFKKGKVIAMWDSEGEGNPALFDTSNGSFSGERVQ
jgi:hypothetical protein